MREAYTWDLWVTPWDVGHKDELCKFPALCMHLGVIDLCLGITSLLSPTCILEIVTRTGAW